MLAWILASTGGDLSRQQVHDRPVLVSRPDRSIEAQETRSGALFAAETIRAVKQSLCEPFETHRNFTQSALQLIHHAIDHAAADQGLSDRGIDGPKGPMCE